MSGDPKLAVLEENTRITEKKAAQVSYNDDGNSKLEMEPTEAPKVTPQESDAEANARDRKEPFAAPQPLLRTHKDVWDKLAAIAPIVSGILIFFMGGFFTYSYNQQQLKLQELQTIERFIPHLTGDEQSKKAAILAISSLTTTELAGRIASLFASSGTVSALKTIAENGDDKQKTAAQTAMAQALENLAARESKLQDLEEAYKTGVDQDISAGQPVDAPAEPNGLIKLANVYKARGQYDLAAQLMIRSLTLKEKLFGSDNDTIVEGLKELAEIYRLKGATREADQCLKRAADIQKRIATAKSPAAVEQQKESDGGTASPTPAHPPAHTPTHVEPPADGTGAPTSEAEPKTSAALENSGVAVE